VDIVSRVHNLSDLSTNELSLLFSAREIAAALEKDPSKHNDNLLVNFALKEAYMKFTGEPNWESLPSIEFLDIQAPGKDWKTVTPAALEVYVSGQVWSGYTECHLADDDHFIAVCTSEAPSRIEKFHSHSIEDLTSHATSRNQENQ